MICLHVEVPVACFRQSRAREYAETYPVPPPATVYGMLLSLLGEWNRRRYCGTRLAIALLNQPRCSRVMRTFRRFKNKEISDPTNARPDYQELLTDVQLYVIVEGLLAAPLMAAFAEPERVERSGGLSLGESRDLVNSISLIQNQTNQLQAQWLIQDEEGLLTLPYWVDHVGSQGTRWQRYSLQTQDGLNLSESAWTEIKPE